MPRNLSQEQSFEQHWLFDPRVLVLLSAAIFIGTFYARAVVSISTGLLAVIACLALVLRKGVARDLLHDRITLSIAAIMGVFLLSGLNSADQEQWLMRLLTNTPYVVLPVACYAYGPLSRQTLLRILGLFIVTATIASAVVLVDYVQHYHDYNEMYLKGQTIPTPIIHVRFSYFVALAALLSLGILAEQWVAKWQRMVTIGTAIFLIIFLHILAVRTGLLALYGGGAVLALVYMIRRRKYREGLIGLIAVCALIFAAYQALPSFKNKIDYMRWDIRQMLDHGASANYSDNVRITSIRHGLTLVGEHPLFGVGIGDIETDINAVYEVKTPHFPEHRRFPPISQYMFWLAAFGICGTALVLWLLLYPLYRLGKGSYLITVLYAATLFSCLAETTLQLQLGKTIFLLLLCSFIQFYRRKMPIQSMGTADEIAPDVAHQT